MTAPAPEEPRAAFSWEDLDQVGQSAVNALMTWWWLRWDVEPEEWIKAAAALLARHVTAARAWGRVRASLDLPAFRAVRSAPGDPGDDVDVPDPPADDPDLIPRLEEAWRTAVERAEDRPDPDATAERLARDEPIAAAQSGYQEVLAEAGVTGYRRRTNPDRCELCGWLEKSHLRPGGYVYPIDQPMFRHTGCRCLPEPTRDPINPRRNR